MRFPGLRFQFSSFNPLEPFQLPVVDSGFLLGLNYNPTDY